VGRVDREKLQDDVWTTGGFCGIIYCLLAFIHKINDIPIHLLFSSGRPMLAQISVKVPPRSIAIVIFPESDIGTGMIVMV
jgi:hypothetical protein